MSKTVKPKRGALIDFDPRVEFLATSNTPPLERERIEMSAILVRVRALIKGWRPAKKISAQKAKLEAYAGKLASVIHHMRSIPPDILSEIFSHLVADPDIISQDVKDDRYVDSLDTNSGVWALTYVCSRWRQIVINTSSLWTTVGLPFDSYSKSSATADILATYLQRSNQHALHVIVHSKDDIAYHPAMDVLMKTCQRWRGAWFALPLDTFLAWETPFPFHQLVKLRVCIQQPELPVAAFTEGSTARCSAFGDAPLLVDLAIDQHVIFHELFDFDWTTLHLFSQELRLPDDFAQSYPVAEIASAVVILTEATSLEIAQFDLHEFDTRFEVDWLQAMTDYMLRTGGVMRNETLPFLVLKGERGGWNRLLSNIELPNLQTLHYHPSSDDERFPEPLPDAMGRSLRKLTVHVVDDTDTEPLQLNMTPDLAELKMIFDKSFDIGPMCTEVFRMTPDVKLVPRLAVLTVTTLRRTKVIIKKEFISALKRRVDGRVFSKTCLEVRTFPSELIVTSKAVQEELDSLMLGPDPFLNSSYLSIA